MKTISLLTLFLTLFMTSFTVQADDSMKPYQFKNGLELYVVEDNSVPLIKFLIIFRTGAMVESSDYDGLSHLYEHMLFKANKLYKSQEEFKEALHKMGCANWNGGTSTEYVKYHATVPYTQLDSIVKFWAYTVRTNTPVISELQKEKNVVINELKMYEGDPYRSFSKKMTLALFGKKYYSRKNVGGDKKVVQSATPEKLLWLKKTYYIPNNCAIFISGDVSRSKAIKAVDKYFGDWKKAPDPFKKYPIPKLPGLDKSKTLIVTTLPNPHLYMWGYNWRGPDVRDAVEDTYPADMLTVITSHLTGRFLKAFDNILWQKEAMNLSYYTQRNGGVIRLTVQLPVRADLEKTKDTLNKIRDKWTEELEKMATDENYFSSKEIAWAIAKQEADEMYNNENCDLKADNLSFWWDVSSADYYANYLENFEKVTGKDLKNFVRKYLFRKPSVQYYWLNKDIASKMKLEDDHD